MNEHGKNTLASVTLRFLAESGTVNLGGKVPGGYACAAPWAKRYCVTARAQLDASPAAA